MTFCGTAKLESSKVAYFCFLDSIDAKTISQHTVSDYVIVRPQWLLVTIVRARYYNVPK